MYYSVFLSNLSHISYIFLANIVVLCYNVNVIMTERWYCYSDAAASLAQMERISLKLKSVHTTVRYLKSLEIISLFNVGVFCFVNGKLDVFVFLSCIFVRLSFPFRGVLRNSAVIWIRVVERTELFLGVGFNYGMFSYSGRKIYVESGVLWCGFQKRRILFLRSWR